MEGRTGGGIQVTGRRGRRCKQLLNGLQETREYCNLEEEAGRTVWRAGFRIGRGPVLRQTKEWMDSSWTAGLFYSEVEGTMIFRNVGNCMTNDIASRRRRSESSAAPLSKPQTSHSSRFLIFKPSFYWRVGNIGFGRFQNRPKDVLISELLKGFREFSTWQLFAGFFEL